MDEIAKALGPAFAAGFAVQRTLEILDPIFGKLGDSKQNHFEPDFTRDRTFDRF